MGDGYAYVGIAAQNPRQVQARTGISKTEMF
jgi:hypothetical protein